MGLWIKNADGTIEKAAGGGGGGTFDGDHVLTGDPLNPPAELDAGQLLWDGVEGGGPGGPHDHDDYLPLTGGTLTGDLQVSGTVATINPGSEGAPAYTSTLYPTTGMYGHAEGVFFAVDGNWTFGSWADRVGIRNDLQVDGVIKASGGTQAAPAITFGGATAGLYGTNTSVTTAVDGAWQHIVYKDLVRIRKSLQADGDVLVGARIKSEYTRDNPTGGVAANVHLSHNGFFYTTGSTRGGPFTPSKLTRSEDVLVKAETATLPPEIETDDGGNILNTAEIEAHDTVELFDVVTALLAKVKQLSAEIEELKGN